MEPSPTRLHQTTETNHSGNVKPESRLFLEKLGTTRFLENLKNHGPSPVMFAEECVFQVEPSTVILLSMSTYSVAIKIGSSAQYLQPKDLPPRHGSRS